MARCRLSELGDGWSRSEPPSPPRPKVLLSDPHNLAKVLAKHAATTLVSLPDETAEPKPPVLVVLCKGPLDPEYLVGLAGRKPVFTRSKKEAKRLEHGDLAIRAWTRALEERYGTDHVFVCYADRRKP